MRKTGMYRASLALAAAGAFSLVAAGAAQADSVADFYRDRTVTVVSPSGTGGSIYQYALLVSKHIGKHIPGEPTVVVEARSGGGGIKAANYVTMAAPGDGTVIAELHPSSLVAPLMGKASYQPTRFRWLGSAATRTYVGVVWHTVPVDSLDDMREQEVVFGGSGVGSASYQYPTFLAHVTGAKLKVISGYKSGGETNLAMERGEIQGRGNYYQGFLATNPDWIRDKKLKFVFRLGPDHKDLASVPTAEQYMKTDEQRQMLKLLEAPLKVGQAFYVSDKVPAERAAALEKAFARMFEDPEFVAEARKINLYISSHPADEVKQVVDDVYKKTPKDVPAKLNKILYKR
jgi:tripartite-type tricarboxylate transporter receptor subunit TctC